MLNWLRKALICGVIFSVIAGVWGVGWLKAELDAPYELRSRVDPAIMQRLLKGYELSSEPSAVIGGEAKSILAHSRDTHAFTFPFAG